MKSLTTDQVVRLQELVIAQSGGLPGVKNIGMVDSAVAQPKMTFGGDELYPSLAEKAAALAFSLARNHGFEDGNKRIAHAAMETFLVLNQHELSASVDEQESIILQLATGHLGREKFTAWVKQNIVAAS